MRTNSLLRFTMTLTVLAIVAVTGAACRATDAPDSFRNVVTNPLQERGTPPVVATVLGGVPATPAAGGPGSAVHPEGATAQAIEFFAQALGIPAGALRLDGVTAGESGGWQVTLRDAFGGRHAADVLAGGVVWRPQSRASGVIVLWRESSGLLVLDVSGASLTLSVRRDSGLMVPPAGTRVRAGYDPSPRGDGVPVLASIEVEP
jgi:hypothetical protein